MGVHVFPTVPLLRHCFDLSKIVNKSIACQAHVCKRVNTAASFLNSISGKVLRWKPPLAGLLGLRELSVGKCGQISAEALWRFERLVLQCLKTKDVGTEGTLWSQMICLI